MSRDKKFSVTITDDMFFEDLLWMSYRYCIGRKTIAASAHAGNIAKNAYNVLSEDRKQFMAHDIRREINAVLHYLDNVNIYDYRHHIPEDGMSTIFYRLLEKYGETPPDWVFTNVKFDIEDETITLDGFNPDKDKFYSQTLIGLYGDLLPWIKLANCLDNGCHKTLVTETDDVKTEYVCFPYPYLSKNANGQYYIDKKWCSIENYLSNPSVDSYFLMDFVVEMK
jgi:hypothetical protein